MRPRIARTCPDRRTASGKSPVTWVSAVRKRLPKLWPRKPATRRESDIERAGRAALHPSKAPPCSCECRRAARTLYSRRNRPELPPSSVTVTIAARSEIGRRRRSSLRRATYSFSPRSSWKDLCRLPWRQCARAARDADCAFFTGKKLSGGTFTLRIEKLGKSGIFLQERKIFVVARVVAIFRAQLNREFQTFHRDSASPVRQSSAAMA